MAIDHTLAALLAAEAEPRQTSYNGTVESVVNDPWQIKRLTEGETEHETLVQLTTRSHRLARVFRGLNSFIKGAPRSSATTIIAADMVALLTQTLPSLHQLLVPAQVLEILIPAIDSCLMLSSLPNSRDLASVLTGCGTLLEHLAADRFGSETLYQWACLRGSVALHPETLEVWTERLVKMAEMCVGNHDVEEATQRWGMLQALKTSLCNVKERVLRPSKGLSTPMTARDLPQLGRMTQLDKEDRKARPTMRSSIKTSFTSFDNDDKMLLKVFDLKIPGSWSTLADVIRCLEEDKTSEILLSILSSFPCNLCISGLSSSSKIASGEKQNESAGAIFNLQIQIEDKAIGIWQIRMSAQALKSVQHLGKHGLSGSATENLRDLASGCWDPQLQPLAGSKSQRKRLRVPVARTRFGKRYSILWQIDVSIDRDTDVPQQEIKVWEVCESPEIPKIIERVIFLQRTYSDEFVRRCCQRPLKVDRMQIPAQFGDDSSQSCPSVEPPSDLDVRTVETDIIEMTNKFYALTEPVIRSVLANDLSAEFPFDLSREEARVLRHFRTASLILGRSGTGKTTCLTMKLVRKYLASKAIVDEKPARQARKSMIVTTLSMADQAQVLLTRSPHLADKLKIYARRLIETLSSEPSGLELTQQIGQVFSATREENIGKEDVTTLRDDSFPLVCTWDDFLQLLENTKNAFDRQEFADMDGRVHHTSMGLAGTERPYNGQVVDGYAFEMDYWPRFPLEHTKNILSSLVFAEIMGIIKGSASSRDSLMPLSRETYLTRSCRLAPTFMLESERLRVYEIFELYEKMKNERGDMDYVDRVVSILTAVRGDPSLKRILRSTFDEIYIDEIQDQRCIDIEMLLSFIRDGRGFHFAGDTAQAISQESTFRFSDVKDIFFQHFSAASNSMNQKEIARPEMFTLSKNYRSHQGILGLASLVMRLIWQGFPDTVDKLEPEIGSLHGPRPVLFVGVSYDILCSSDVSRNSLSTVASDFGADQVILVRDAKSKAQLQEQIGEDALVLTILESKGMEFDDVILWNFFTACPNQVGVRSLDILKNDPARFDSRRHGGMCPELKSLYVAITRARIHLFIMEGSENTAVSVIRFLSQDASQTLVEVTGPDHDDFAMRVDMLRPGTFLEPEKWHRRATELLQRRMYKDALRCFRKAKDSKGEMTSEAYLREEDGRRCNAMNDNDGFSRNSGAAVELFKKMDLFGDAARVLATLGKLQEAAGLCFERNLYARASPLFAQAGLYVKAAECHRLLDQHSEAADMLRRGSHYDELVSYLNEFSEKLSPSHLRGYKLLYKLLIKQNKVLSERDSPALQFIGSTEEQEAFFLEYKMDKHLTELYAEQKRYLELYHLLSKTGQLEKAFNLIINEYYLRSSSKVSKSEILRMIDYICAGSMEKGGQLNLATTLGLPPNSLTPEMILRTKQWESTYLVYNTHYSDGGLEFMYIESTVAKSVLTLRKALDVTAINQSKTFDAIPFCWVAEAIRFAKDLVVNGSTGALRTLLILTGLWKSDVARHPYVLMPWSPLRRLSNVNGLADAPKAAMEWFLEELASVVLAMDTVAREMWKSRWPTRCVQFLTNGFCPRQQHQEDCRWSHQMVSEHDCSQVLENLLRVSYCFCDLAALFYRRAMNEAFQDRYLSIKRHWLERLIRELLHLSATEQDSSVIKSTQAQLCGDQKDTAIACFLQDLLYHRLRKDWIKGNSFTSLLEQMQLAQKLGSNVQNRMFRAMSGRLRHDDRRLLQGHLSLLYSLEQGLGDDNACTFQCKLETFLGNLDKIDIQGFSTLHALTTVFEYFAVYLILKTCASACVLTQTWANLHVPRFADAITSLKRPKLKDSTFKYQQCLTKLTQAFCKVLHRFNELPHPGIELLCNGKTHHSSLLRRRNAELVALVIANLAPDPPTGFVELWKTVKEVFGYNFVRAYHLRDFNPSKVALKLALSFSRYNGKDALLVVTKDPKKGSRFSDLEHQPSVKTVLFEELCPTTPILKFPQPSDGFSPSTAAEAQREECTPAETEAIIKIQRMWRSCSSKIKRRRSYISTPEYRATARLFNSSTHCPATTTLGDRKAIRKLLVLQGVSLSLRLLASQEITSSLQTDSMAFIENVEASVAVYASIDTALGRNREAEALLDEAEREISDERVDELVKCGLLHNVEDKMEKAEAILVKAEGFLKESREILDAMSNNRT